MKTSQPTVRRPLRLALAAACLALAATACKNYLDVPPQGALTDQNFFSTQRDALLGVNATYAVLRYENFGEGSFPILDIMSDDARKGSYPGDQQDRVGLPFDQFQVVPSNDLVREWFRALYLGVRRANAVIERVPSIAMDEALKNRYLAEARFLRALFYLDLARGYGAVPKVTTLRPGDAQDLGRTPPQQIYSEIIVPDLKFAAANLPPSYPAAEQGRATSGAASALLARAALYFTWKDPALFATVRDAAKAVIDQSLYGLEDDYMNAFWVPGYYGRESVFEIGAIGVEDNDGTDHGGLPYGHVQAVRGVPNRGYGFNRPSMPFLRSFEAGDQRRRKTYIQLGETIDGQYIAGDPDTPEVIMAGGDTLEFECYNRKYWVPGSNVASAFGAHRKMIRYADVLLMYAEGVLETGGDAQTALNALNLVRHRAGLGDRRVSTPDSMRAFVYDERRHELGLESSRFYDLVRTSRAAAVLGPLGFVPGKNETLPFPQVEIDISGNAFAQDEGYK